MQDNLFICITIEKKCNTTAWKWYEAFECAAAPASVHVHIIIYMNNINNICAITWYPYNHYYYINNDNNIALVTFIFGSVENQVSFRFFIILNTSFSLLGTVFFSFVMRCSFRLPMNIFGTVISELLVCFRCTRHSDYTHMWFVLCACMRFSGADWALFSIIIHIREFRP